MFCYLGLGGPTPIMPVDPVFAFLLGCLLGAASGGLACGTAFAWYEWKRANAWRVPRRSYHHN
jgi:hypothetical protein